MMTRPALAHTIPRGPFPSLGPSTDLKDQCKGEYNVSTSYIGSYAHQSPHKSPILFHSWSRWVGICLWAMRVLSYVFLIPLLFALQFLFVPSSTMMTLRYSSTVPYNALRVTRHLLRSDGSSCFPPSHRCISRSAYLRMSQKGE